MFLDSWAWVVSKINASAELIALLGNLTEHFSMSFPNETPVFPLLVGHEINAPTVEWHDDTPYAVDSELEFDVYVLNASYYPICNALTLLLINDLWNLTYSADVPDPLEGAAHRNMRFARRVTSDDLET